MDIFHQCVSVRLSVGDHFWTCSAIYASTIPAVRENLWTYLEGLRSDVQNSWVLLGDYNDILMFSEVRGGAFFPSKVAKFKNVIQRCQLLDIGAINHKFTWFRRAVGNKIVAKIWIGH